MKFSFKDRLVYNNCPAYSMHAILLEVNKWLDEYTLNENQTCEKVKMSLENQIIPNVIFRTFSN